MKKVILLVGLLAYGSVLANNSIPSQLRYLTEDGKGNKKASSFAVLHSSPYLTYVNDVDCDNNEIISHDDAQKNIEMTSFQIFTAKVTCMTLDMTNRK